MEVPRIVQTSLRLWDLVSYKLGVVASSFAIIMGLLICVEVIARGLFSQSTYIVFDVVGFLFAGIIFLGLAETYRSQEHIRMDIVSSRLPSSVRKLLMEIIFPFIAVVYLSFLFVRATSLVITSYEDGTRTVGIVELTLWPAQLLMPVGLFVFTVLVFLYFLRGWWTVLAGRKTRSPVGNADTQD